METWYKMGEADTTFSVPETGRERMDMPADERRFDTGEIERKVTAPDSNRKIIEELKKYALEHEARYGRFPKPLIFGANGDSA
jgi:type I restriction enzyme R subunit